MTQNELADKVFKNLKKFESNVDMQRNYEKGMFEELYIDISHDLIMNIYITEKPLIFWLLFEKTAVYSDWRAIGHFGFEEAFENLTEEQKFSVLFNLDLFLEYDGDKQ